MSKTSNSIWTLLIPLVAIVVGGFGFRTCEAGDEESLRTIHSAGFADPQLGDYDAWECGSGEASRSFMATNPRGDRVKGVVCCSITGCTKACTLRWP